jgi:hypothetical protein
LPRVPSGRLPMPEQFRPPAVRSQNCGPGLRRSLSWLPSPGRRSPCRCRGSWRGDVRHCTFRNVGNRMPVTAFDRMRKVPHMALRNPAFCLSTHRRQRSRVPIRTPDCDVAKGANQARCGGMPRRADPSEPAGLARGQASLTASSTWPLVRYRQIAMYAVRKASGCERDSWLSGSPPRRDAKHQDASILPLEGMGDASPGTATAIP